MEQYEKCIGHRHCRVVRYGADVIETFALLNFLSGKMVEHSSNRWLGKRLFEIGLRQIPYRWPPQTMMRCTV